MELDRENVEIGMISRLSRLEGKRVLEVGCGDGRVTAFLAEKTGGLVAIDPDGESIAEARENIKGVDFRVGSGEALEFEDKSFDLVMFTMSLHHHRDCKKALREAHRVLGREGQLILLEPALDGEIQRIFHLFTDETEGIEQALDAIEGSQFYTEHCETFSKDWVFEDSEELYNYHFEHYGDSRYNGSIVGSINELLGGRIDERPIVVKDKVTIFSMRKENLRRKG
ncbi:MAG: class I SAM-dependent methyltransferase [Thermodesulfobacteriota bacterium]|nr:class I SAM-dependent methyltransferase [Thermodesulfobacteriota bacterium]